MSAFPSLPWTLSSKESWIDDRQTERASNGALRGRAFYAAKKKAFELSFAVLSAAEKSLIEAHYDANRTGDFTFTWRDGMTYTVAYAKDGVKLEPVAGAYWSGTVGLEQV